MKKNASTSKSLNKPTKKLVGKQVLKRVHRKKAAAKKMVPPVKERGTMMPKPPPKKV